MTPFPRADYGALSRYTPDRRPVELDLSDNTNLWGTHPGALRRIRSADTDDLARYPELYADTLRDAVAARFGVGPACVTTGAGSDDVLDSAFRAASGPGALVSYAAPTFSMIEPLAKMNGMRARAIAWPHAIEAPDRLLTDDPALIYVCRPNNPTGELVPVDWLERMIGACRDVDGGPPLVIVDEAYGDFAGESFIPRASELPNVLVTRTASKAFGLAGLRCGFGVAHPDVADEVEKSRGPYKVARLAAEAVAEALRDTDGWMAGTVAECVQNRSRLARELDDRGLRAFPSHANFILFEAPSGAAKADALALRERGVAVRPFEEIPDLREALRVTVGPWPMMERFLAALDGLREVGRPSPSAERARR